MDFFRNTCLVGEAPAHKSRQKFIPETDPVKIAPPDQFLCFFTKQRFTKLIGKWGRKIPLLVFRPSSVL